MFAQDTDAGQIARSLRVSTKSVYQWRRAWRGGVAALASRGPGGNACKLDENQLARLSTALDAGPRPAAGSKTKGGHWPGSRCWSPGCPGVEYTLRGVSYLRHRMGFTPQVAVHRAAERDEDAIAAWRSQTWAKVRG